MKTKNYEMRRIFYSFVFLICMLFAYENAYAGSSYYATLQADVANSSHVGKVYVNTDNSEAAQLSHADTKDTDTENGNISMNAYAYPSEGYELYRWEFVSAARNTKSKNNPKNHTAADITSTTSPLTVSMLAPSGSKNDSEKASLLVVRAIFWRPGGANISKLTFKTTENGKYSVKSIAREGTTQTEYDYKDIRGTAKEVSNVVAGMPIDCKAVADAGYVFYSYYTLDAYGNKAYVGDLFNSDQVLLLEDDVVALGAEFTDNSYCIGQTLLPTLSDALQFVQTSDVKTIRVVRDDTVAAGYYTIPTGVTLLIPVDARQMNPTTKVERVNENSTKPSAAYKTVTLASGAHLDVFGAIEVGGRQNSYANNGTGRPQGKTYGHLIMNSGSSITLESGSNLYAWGFVTGAGEKDEEGRYKCSIDVRRGATVREMFQVYDWEGGSEALDMYGNEFNVFMINEYFIQNVEVPTVYRPGSALYGYTGLKGIEIDDVKLIGVEGDEAAMFLMDNGADSEDTWVRKWYNPATDQQVYEINNAAKLGNLHITYSGYVFASEDYILPITNNMKIHVLNGEMEITQSTVLLAGAEIEVDKKATAIIKEGESLFVFDYHEWDAHIHQDKYALRAEVRPGGIATVRDISSTEGLGNAKINVHGTFVAAGTLYTTESGASIYSNNDDAGTILCSTAVPATPTLDLYVHSYTAKPKYYTRPIVPAILRNEDAGHPTTATAGTAAGQSYCYINNIWRIMTVDSDSSCFVYDNYGTYYAKPAGYVAINATKDPSTKKISGNPDHTYSDAAGTGRLFILVDDCQWWEVENVDNLYHCTHPQNDTYYYWNGTKWEEKKFAISWKDYDGSAILDANDNPIVYNLPYGATPKFLSENPTRPADPDFTYNFKGWSPELTSVSGDQVYTAVYDKIPVKYEIIFKYEEGIKSGAVIKRQFLVRDAIPEPPTLYPIEGYSSYEWTPAIGAVTGNQVYEAKWLEDIPETYAITFKNFDGSILKKNDGESDATYEVTAGERPEYDGATPTKPATAEYTYSFAGWKALNGTIYSNDNLPVASEKTSYVAQFNSAEKKFDIRFYDENGEQIGETQSLRLGADPEVPEYGKDNTAEYTYQLQWKIKGTSTIVGVSVPSVSAAVDYQADFIATKNRYTITATCETPNGCVITGAGTFDYGTQVSLTVIPNEGYTFDSWSDEETANPRVVTVTENDTYTAIVHGAPVVKVANDETTVITTPKKVSALVISATPTTSSDIVGAENLTNSEGESSEEIINNIPVNFDLTRGAGKVFKHHTWYAFSVPFTVDPATILFDGVTMQYHTENKKDDYEILYYDGSERALHGKTANCWVKAETGNENLVPGRFYMIAITKRDVTTIRFPKVAGTALLTTSVNVTSYDATTGTGKEADANWNGIANPALYHANMNAIGSTESYAYTYNPDFEDPTNAYQRITLNTQSIKLGTPFFVQAPIAKSVVVSPVSGPSAAPRRVKVIEEQSIRYQVLIAREGGESTDDVIIRMDEDKEEDTYIIGTDLVRMGMSTMRPQLWVNRYNEKLCVNVVAPNNGKANYPLGIFVPATGDYTLSLAAQPNDEDMLYLTKDGRVIWNLTYGPYTGVFEQGTTSSYALRIVAAPKVTTDVEEAVVDAQGEIRKVLINNQVFIIRGDQVYTIEGQLVK